MFPPETSLSAEGHGGLRLAEIIRVPATRQGRTLCRVHVAASTLWTTADWRSEVEAWIDSVLAREGCHLTGPIEQPRLKPWSTQLTVPTSAGRWWFKENAPALRHEAAVVAALAEVVPARVVPPIAVDPTRGWLLSADQGPTLMEAGNSGPEAWHRIVTEFAQLQRRVSETGPVLANAGIPRLIPADLPDWALARTDELASLPPSDPRAMTAAEAHEVAAAAAHGRQDAALLAAAPIPLSIEHNDLHSNNAFVPVDGAALRFFDFGDAVWGHPFCTLLIPQRTVEGDFGPIERSYLQVWSDLAPVSELRPVLRAALRLAHLHRAHSWTQVLSTAPAAQLGELARALAEWLLLWARVIAENRAVAADS